MLADRDWWVGGSTVLLLQFCIVDGKTWIQGEERNDWLWGCRLTVE